MANHAPPHHEHHIVPTRVYFMTLVALVILMYLTVFVAEFNLPGIGPLSGTVVNQLAALIIACIKASLVVTIFMGVRWGTTLIKLWACAGAVWMFLIFGILGDYVTRNTEVVPSWDGKPEAGLPRTTPEHELIPPVNANDLNVKIRQ